MFIGKEYIRLDTPHTTLLFKIIDESSNIARKGLAKYLKPVHYGVRLKDGEHYEVLANDAGNNASISCFGNFDKREPMVFIVNADGSLANDFEFLAARRVSGVDMQSFPSAHTIKEILEIEYYDTRCKLRLFNYLCVFADTDAITSSYKLCNEGSRAVKIKRLMSLQCDICGSEFTKYSFQGDWISERMLNKAKLPLGVTGGQSLYGMSSHACNPYFLLERGRFHDFYAFNILYSGDYRNSVEVTFQHTARILVGVNDFAAEFDLAAGEAFVTPQAVQVYAQKKDAVVKEMHSFVKDHILRGKFANAERPVVINNWEATYFQFDSQKILDLAKAAKEIGVELFVLDDGWFSDRNDDSHGLGDWADNVEKTGGGLRALADRIRGLGLQFGVWIEPEMVNPTAKLFAQHPEWAMRIPGREIREWRHQYVLDLANPVVVDFLYETVSDILLRSGAEYVKWDFNRSMTEFYSPALQNQGEYCYRYMQGFYRLLEKITEKFPDVLFEGCAGGGGRYDLGMMCYMPQIWTSDNTDARVRLKIQEGSLYGYPQSVMSAHVSIVPNHQTQQTNSLESRFNVAAAGILGYEYDLTQATPSERECMKRQIAFYKRHRRLFQYGEYHLLESYYDDCDGYASYIVLSPDKSEAIATVVLHDWKNYASTKIRFGYLDDDALYAVNMRPQTNVAETAEFTAYGSLLNHGLLDFGGLQNEIGRAENSNGIFSRMFYFRKIK